MKPIFTNLGTGKSASPFRLTLFFLIPSLIALTAIFLSLIAWESKKIGEDEISELKEVSRAFFEQIMVSRTWNAGHGGVYVEVTPDTPPNPYLGNDPHRDMVSTDGRRYTKINPAYMTRQLSEIANKTHGYKFHIVSLTPINLYNAPDAWEKNALEEFEKGKAAEAVTVYKERDGKRAFKYIAPIKIEDPCLKCHAGKGFRHGAIRGGVSIIIPMVQYDRIQSMKIRRTVISILAVGAVSFLFIAAITIYLSGRLSREIEKNIEQKKLAAAVELAGATAHELRQPMTVIQNLVTLFSEKLKNREPLAEEEMNIIVDQTKKMNDVIKKMLNITSYKTKDYLRGKKIVDIDGSSKGS